MVDYGKPKIEHMEKTLPFLLLAQGAFNIITLFVTLFFIKRNKDRTLGAPIGIWAFAYIFLCCIMIFSLYIITHQDHSYMLGMILPFIETAILFKISGNGNPIPFLNEDGHVWEV